jgi:hypothetical protein
MTPSSGSEQGDQAMTDTPSYLIVIQIVSFLVLLGVSRKRSINPILLFG